MSSVEQMNEGDIMKMASIAGATVETAIHVAGTIRKSMIEEGFDDMIATEMALEFLKRSLFGRSPTTR